MGYFTYTYKWDSHKGYNLPLILTSPLIHPNFQLPAHPSTTKTTTVLNCSTGRRSGGLIARSSASSSKASSWAPSWFFSSFGFWGKSGGHINQGLCRIQWVISPENISQNTSRWNNRFPLNIYSWWWSFHPFQTYAQSRQIGSCHETPPQFFGRILSALFESWPLKAVATSFGGPKKTPPFGSNLNPLEDGYGYLKWWPMANMYTPEN